MAGLFICTANSAGSSSESHYLYFTVSPQVQIVLAICLFYLYDAAIGLQAHEGLLRPARNGWRARLATQGFELRRAYLLWPPLFLLHRPIYRLGWNSLKLDLPDPASGHEQLIAHAQSLRGFTVPLYTLALLLLIALPLTLLVWPMEWLLLTLAALIYLNTLLLSVLTWRHASRQTAANQVKLVRSLAVQILLCPPFALNVVRKLGLGFTANCNLPQAAMALLPTEQWQALAAALYAQVQQQAQAEQEDAQWANEAGLTVTDKTQAAQRQAKLQEAIQQLQPHLPHAVEDD